MKFLIIVVIIFVITIAYFINKIEKMQMKILYLSKENHSLLNELKTHRQNNNYLDEDNVNLIPVNTKNVYTKNISFLKMAPFDSAPKITNVPSNSNVTIICKTKILNICWYEISFVNKDSKFYKGWVKDNNIEFIYHLNP